jgi:LPXTG-site transpeptidase (sortase) family protein
VPIDRSPERRTTALVASLSAVVVAAGLGFAIADDRCEARARTATTATAPADPAPRAERTPGPASAPSPSPSSGLPDIPIRDATAPRSPDRVVPPVNVTLPALGVDLPVEPVGVTDDGQMQIPADAEQAGWYEYGPAPGAVEGTAVIAAHVDSIASKGLGPFAKLRDLQVGDQAAVRLADGTAVTYVVDRVDSVPKTDVVWPDVFTRDGPPRLVLITCGGRWQPAIRHYANNVMVSLSPVGQNGPA